VAADGAVLWSGALTAGQALREAAIQAPAAGTSGTAYLGSADGKVYAVAIEGHLDVTAPWPKAHRDLRNTSNAASTLP
jgi:outer membrane protein assembly factor BamB